MQKTARKKKLDPTTAWPKAPVKLAARQVGVDRKANAILGYIMAEEGAFKSEGRGEFDVTSLKLIAKLANAKASGLKSRFAHPSLSGDGIGTFLGRAKNARLDQIERDGKTINVVRGDLHLSPTSFETPSGNLGKYVLDLAESDPDAFGSSLVLQYEPEHRVDEKGRALKGPDGHDLPPLWRPTALHASDVVDEGDATHSFLAPEAAAKLPDAVVRQGAALLDKQFSGQPREVVQARCNAWLGRYLDLRYGPAPVQPAAVGHEPFKLTRRPASIMDELLLATVKEPLMKEKPCACKNTLAPAPKAKLGKNLGDYLNGLIDGVATDERPREAIVEEMATESGMETAGIEAVLDGSENCPMLDALVSFARVLAAPLSACVAAAEADGCDYTAKAEEEAPAEDDPEAMSFSQKILERVA